VSDVGSQITSNAIILGSETVMVASDAMVYKSGSAATLPIFMAGRSTDRTSESRGVLIHTTDISTSDEVVVADMITSNPMDMLTIAPPLGYQNYDWKYDWVVRTYNSAQYRFEIRAEDTLSELYTAVFSEIHQGQIILRGHVPRYHQWRCHVWASGSGDFELHQFTIKGYVDQPANSLYRSLQDQIFTTVSTIKKGVQRPYEPLNPKLWGGTYIPGDCNADEIVDVYDQVYLAAYISYGGPAPSPLLAGDVNCDGIVNVADFTYLTQYLDNNGAPPIWHFG
ncbi:MAG: dockerin type I repeat-containing protein, partial [Candidatus Thorarchaeota archaeon]